MRNLGWPELLVILLVIVVLFGARKLPDLARSLGKSLSEFKKGREEAEKPDSKETEKKDEK
ncbi:MAG: twin-arginine translocase TatA/TatE family subunit [bacterium]